MGGLWWWSALLACFAVSAAHQTAQAHLGLAHLQASAPVPESLARQPAHNEGSATIFDVGVAFLEGQHAGHGRGAGKTDVRPALVVGCCVVALVVILAMAYIITSVWPTTSSATQGMIFSYATLIGCFLGLCISFVCYGIIQEYIMTQRYASGHHFPSSVFLVFCNRTVGVMVLTLVLLWKRQPFFPTGCQWCSIPAITLFISSTCQYSSLRYVSFPVQIAFKSGKIVPTMVVGIVMLSRRYSWKDYMMAAMITTSVIGFSLSVEDFGKDERSTRLYGVTLLLIFLFCDALTSNGEKKIFNSYPDMGAFQMMFVMALFSMIYSIVSVLLMGTIKPLFAFLADNPIVWLHILGLSICAVSGQLFVFYIIKTYGPVVFSIMMTIRLVFSMTTSAILFGHEISPFAWFCAFCTFMVLFVDSASKLMASNKDHKQDQKSQHA